jgi:uncharacterized YigZ family protein
MIPINPDFYYTISGRFSGEIKVKGSRFIATADNVSDKEAAEDFVDEIRKIYYDASHNCFAYRINDSVLRYSDDGEPSGTAGKPILDMLDKYRLLKTVLVVTRYFGGTKLGTGGLVRAYRSGAENLLESAGIVKKQNYQILRLQYPFNMTSRVQQLVRTLKGTIKEDATTRGVIARVQIVPSKIEQFIHRVTDITAAQVIVQKEKNGK